MRAWEKEENGSAGSTPHPEAPTQDPDKGKVVPWWVRGAMAAAQLGLAAQLAALGFGAVDCTGADEAKHGIEHCGVHILDLNVM